MLLEVCFDSAAGLERALRGRAGRFEVCSRLDLDGLTPTDELLAAAVATGTKSFAMVRPRGGSHAWARTEHAALRADLERMKRGGAHGVVLGALTAEGDVDRELTAELVALARPLPVTFHRAFDRVRDRRAALEVLVELGVRRVLTSGGAADAHAGREELRALVEQARGRIVVLPGGGVRAHNARAIVATAGVRELHSSVPFDVDAAL